MVFELDLGTQPDDWSGLGDLWFGGDVVERALERGSVSADFPGRMLEGIEVFVCAGRDCEGPSISVRRVALRRVRAASAMLVAACGQTSCTTTAAARGLSARGGSGARCCSPVPTGLWLMENLEYPVQSIPQGRDRKSVV